MAENRINELGLAEFVAGLISETFEAVSVSIESQVSRQTELLAAAELDLSTYAAKYVSTESIDQACGELFPAEDGGNTIETNGAYIPGEETVEQPPIKRVLGLSLKNAIDYRKRGSTWQLTTAGVESIRTAIKMQAAQYHQDALRLLLNKGLPRIVIDSGRILSKVTFSVNSSDSEKSGVTPVVYRNPNRASDLTSSTVFKASLLNRLGKTRANLLLPDMQLKIRPVTDDQPQSSTTSVYGEVEISFRTVT